MILLPQLLNIGFTSLFSPILPQVWFLSALKKQGKCEWHLNLTIMRKANLDMEVSWTHRALFLGVHWDSVMDVTFICGHGCAAPHRACFHIMQRPVCLNKAVNTHSPGPGRGQKSGSPYRSILCPQADPFQKLGHIHTKSSAELRRIQPDFQS